jgi:hypothetical protein
MRVKSGSSALSVRTLFGRCEGPIEKSNLSADPAGIADSDRAVLTAVAGVEGQVYVIGQACSSGLRRQNCTAGTEFRKLQRRLNAPQVL